MRASDGLATWTTFLLDGLLSARIVHADQLHGLDADELTELARAALRHALDGFDANTTAATLSGKVAA